VTAKKQGEHCERKGNNKMRKHIFKKNFCNREGTKILGVPSLGTGNAKERLNKRVLKWEKKFRVVNHLGTINRLKVQDPIEKYFEWA